MENIYKFTPIPMIDKNNKVFDIVDKEKNFHIFDYHFSMDYTNKTEISCIADLKKYLHYMVDHSVHYIYYTNKIPSPEVNLFSISDEENEMITTQLVMDILFDNYCSEQTKILRSHYSNYMAHLLTEVLYQYDVNNTNTIQQGSVRDKIENTMKQYSNMIANSALKSEVSALGFDSEKYIEYFIPPKKDSLTKIRSKYFWDFVFYNCNLLSGIQYDRKKLKPTNESKNYKYEDKINDFKFFHKFAGAILSPHRITYDEWEKKGGGKNKKMPISIFNDPNENLQESAEDFFVKIMEYYYLESYKRIEFMLKYANYLKDTKNTDESKINYNYLAVLQRFHPIVVCPKIDSNNNIEYAQKYNYYRPMLLAETKLLEKVFIEGSDIVSEVLQLQKYQLIRAKAYELFRFHAKFMPSDYEDIKQFIEVSYNLRTYHESVKIDEYLDPVNKSGQATTKTKNIIKTFIELNNVLFPDSDKRKENKDTK